MHKNGIGTTFTHTSIPFQPCILLKQRPKPSTHLRLLVFFLSNVVVSDGQEACQIPIRTALHRRQMYLNTASTSEAFSPRTVLTENTCRCVQQIIHLQEIITFLTISTTTLAILLHGPESAHKNGIVKTFVQTSIPIHTPCTQQKNQINQLIKNNNKTFHDKNALSNNLYNNLFLPGFSSSPGWFLVTRTRGAWWYCYRIHCRSGPRHLTPRSRVYTQEWHHKDIHSHIHSHTHSMHTPQKIK